MSFGGYRITDFILFSRESWDSVRAAYVSAIAPAPFVWYGISLVIAYLVLRRNGERLVWLATGASWVLVGAIFHYRYFQTINWTAVYFAGLFVFEGALLIYLGAGRNHLRFSESRPRRLVAITVFALAAFVPWLPQDQFGWGPDQTALGTIALILAARSGSLVRALILIPPLAWIALSIAIQTHLR